VNYKTFLFELIRLYYTVREVSLFLARPVKRDGSMSRSTCRITSLHTTVVIRVTHKHTDTQIHRQLLTGYTISSASWVKNIERGQ